MTLKDKIQTTCIALDGWTSPDRLHLMADLILKEKPSIVVELGVFGGRSFIAQALALKENGSGVIFGIDPWRKAAAIEGENRANQDWWGTLDYEAVHKMAMNAVWDNDLAAHAVVIRSESQHASAAFSNNSIDILNIDANHSEIASCRDATLYLPKVKSGGHIFFDDCDWATTHKAQVIVEQQCDVIMDNGHWKMYKKR